MLWRPEHHKRLLGFDRVSCRARTQIISRVMVIPAIYRPSDLISYVELWEAQRMDGGEEEGHSDCVERVEGQSCDHLITPDLLKSPTRAQS